MIDACRVSVRQTTDIRKPKTRSVSPPIAICWNRRPEFREKTFCEISFTSGLEGGRACFHVTEVLPSNSCLVQETYRQSPTDQRHSRFYSDYIQCAASILGNHDNPPAARSCSSSPKYSSRSVVMTIPGSAHWRRRQAGRITSSVRRCCQGSTSRRSVMSTLGGMYFQPRPSIRSCISWLRRLPCC